MSPKQYLTKLVEADVTIAAENRTKAVVKANTAANRVKWILDATMGAAGDFERRREELKIIEQKTGIFISAKGLSVVLSVSF